MSGDPERHQRQAVVVDLEQRRRLRAARSAVRFVRPAREPSERAQAKRGGEAAGAVVLLLGGSGIRRLPRRRLGKGKR
jgi:hypothetical protein